VFGLLGFTVSTLIAPQWEAVAMLKPGLVAGESVETLGQVVERVRGPEMLRVIGKKVGVSDDAGFLSLKKRIKVSIFDDGVKIVTRGGSVQSAENLADLVVRETLSQHAALVQNRVALIQASIDTYRKQIKMDKVADPAGKLQLGNGITLAMYDRQQEVLSDLEAKLLAPKTLMTSVSLSPCAWANPVFPNKFLSTALLFLIGLTLGVSRSLMNYKGI